VLPTLSRYLLRRWISPLLGALFFYGGLILAWEMKELSKLIFSMGAPFQWLIPGLLIQVPETLGMVFPMAAVLGGLLGSQHLSEGSEMVASQGLGVGMRSILKPWLLLSAGLLVITTVNAHVIVPKSNALQQVVQNRMVEDAQTRFLKPGSPPFFPPQKPNNAIWIDATGEIHVMESSPLGVQHLVAHSMDWAKVEKNGELSSINIEFKDLNGSLVQKANGSIVHIRQKAMSLSIPVPAPTRPRIAAASNVRYLSTGELFRNLTPNAIIEIGLRFSLPVATCALLLLGIALGIGHPRFQRGGAILKSLGVILVYYLLIQLFKDQISVGKYRMVVGILLLPWGFLAAGFLLLWRRLLPHRSAPGYVRRLLGWAKKRLLERAKRPAQGGFDAVKRVLPHPMRLLNAFRMKHKDQGTLARWTRNLWWRNWGATLGTFLTLSLLIEFTNLASDLSKNHVSMVVFLRYWLFNLPPFLVIVLPIAFLFGGVLALSEATLSREWVALRAGGTSLIQWARAGARAWGSILALTLLTQVFLAPAVVGQAESHYNRIKDRPPVLHVKPWLYLGSTGVLWFLEGQTRWGFPLKPQDGTAPVILRWNMHGLRAEALPWNALNWVSGPLAGDLFPDQALRDVANPEEATTPDLFRWHRWAPDPERAALLWGRILNWLAGPCLLFAMLPFAFPTPRGGRGQALGVSLVFGLLFMGTQALFGGAARAGEIPGFWGVMAPLTTLFGIGLLGLRRLRT
jgi:lipopolysaccharide export system permease protein